MNTFDPKNKLDPLKADTKYILKYCLAGTYGKTNTRGWANTIFSK